RFVGTWRGVCWMSGVQTVLVFCYRADGTYTATATPQVIFAQSITDCGRWTYSDGCLTHFSQMFGASRDAVTWFAEDQYQATCVSSCVPGAVGLTTSYSRVK